MKKFREIKRSKDFSMLGWDKSFMNDVYVVDIRWENKETGLDGFLWMAIKRKDKNWIRDWRQLQKIKNMICGEEREGCELYPAESRLVDTSNEYHIFVLPKGDKFPFGYGNRLIVEGHKGGWNKGSSQRPFKYGEEPADVKTLEEVKDMADQLGFALS